MSNVAERISIRLERVGLSAHAASLAAGLSRSAVTDILAGNSNSPRLDTLEKLCGPLQCSIHYLVSDEPQPVEARPLGDGGPAFPHHDSGSTGTRPGMSLRQWYAGQALVGLCANPGGPFQANSMQGWGMCNCDENTVAQTAVTLADALLAELADRIETVRS